MKFFFKETGQFRKDFKQIKEPLLGLRDELKGNIDKVKDIEKKLKDVLYSDGVDINYSVQIYKEVSSSTYKSDLLEEVFNVI